MKDEKIKVFVYRFLYRHCIPSHEATGRRKFNDGRNQNYLSNRTSAEITATGDYRTSEDIKGGENRL
jgi:hypothetical protein